MRYSILSVLLVACVAAASPPTPDVNVVNGADDPIPVSGEISAEVSGRVAVDDVPDELTDRMDMVLDRLEELIDKEAAQPAVADFVRQRYLEADNSGAVDYQIEKLVAVSTLLISAENDKLVFLGCKDATAPCFGDYPSVRLGSVDQQFPGVIAINFPNPVPLQKFRVRCYNGGDIDGNCEVHLTIVGMVLE
jgi:hypothetical protein